ncbi:MAG: DUF2161 family putative PD-(D/E)XK-type phosphodiesterase [Pseudomonadota bacterium]
MTRAAETELYEPVKRFLERQGYSVKGEVGEADIVAVRGDEDPVIVELKTGFSLALFHQAIDRLNVSDTVYVAVPRGEGRAFQKSLKANHKLCRRLGLGLLVVRLKDGFVEPIIDPGPYAPRKSNAKSMRLLKEFEKRVGDPMEGGSTRKPMMTAYRQDALRCLHILNQNGPTKAAEVAALTNVPLARRLMADNHYGWFDRVDRGVYSPSPKGERALIDYADQIARLFDHAERDP